MLEQQSAKGFTELENAVLTVNSKSFKTYGDAMMSFAGILWRGFKAVTWLTVILLEDTATEQCKTSQGKNVL